MARKRKPIKKIKNCPICGDDNITVWRSVTRRIKPWFIHCEYCHHCSDRAQTRRGAMRKWNKSTNIIDVSDRR